MAAVGLYKAALPGASTAGSGMIVTALLSHLARVQLAEGILEIGERTLGLANLSIVLAQNLRVTGRLADELGGFEELALRLDALVHILDLLVQLVRLKRVSVLEPSWTLRECCSPLCGEPAGAGRCRRRGQ